MAACAVEVSLTSLFRPSPCRGFVISAMGFIGARRIQRDHRHQTEHMSLSGIRPPHVLAKSATVHGAETPLGDGDGEAGFSSEQGVRPPPAEEVSAHDAPSFRPHAMPGPFLTRALSHGTGSSLLQPQTQVSERVQDARRASFAASFEGRASRGGHVYEASGAAYDEPGRASGMDFRAGERHSYLGQYG